MSSRDTEKVLSIPSIRLSTSLLEDICKLLKKEYDKFDKADKEFEEIVLVLRSSIEGTERVRGPDVFGKNEISKYTKEVNVSLRGLGKTIEIHVEVDQIRDESYFAVKGTDRTWVNGVIGSLHDIFYKYKNRNDFFRNTSSGALIYMPLAALFTYVVYLMLKPISDPQLFDLFLTGVIGFPMMSAIGWYFLLRWLFPKFEVPEMFRIRVRKAILGIISGILIGIIVLYIQAWVELPFISD